MLTVTLNSVVVALAVAALVMAAVALMVVTVAYRPSRPLTVLAGIASSGYAFPGTILAIGVVTFAGAVDRGLDGLIAGVMGLSFDGFLTGGIGLVLFACMVRFQAIGYGALTAGMKRLPRDMVSAGRVLGLSLPANLVRVILPLLGTSFLAGGLLVFVDVMKELPMTLLLRPFGFDTLAQLQQCDSKVQSSTMGYAGAAHRPRRHRPRDPDERGPPPPRRGPDGDEVRGLVPK